MKFEGDVSLTNYSNLIDLVYDAAAKPELWPELLAELNDFLAIPDNLDDVNLQSQINKSDLLEPHLTRAIRLNQHIVGLETKNQTIEQILNRIPIGVIITNAEAVPLAMNSRAQLVLDAQRCLLLKNGVLNTHNPIQNSELLSLIQSYATKQTTQQGSAMLLQVNHDGMDSLTSLWLTTTDTLTDANIHEKQLCMIYIASPLIKPSFNIKSIQQSFGLTGAEAKLVKTLANGCNNLNEVAKKLDISIHTARSQIKAIFEKTNTNSQLELIKRILTSPSVLFGEYQSIETLPQQSSLYKRSDLFQSIRLHDGRRMSYAEYGDPEGDPVIFCHAVAGSRLQYPKGDKVAAKLGLRMIVPDRPGMGCSDIKDEHTLLDWPLDLIQLVDFLGIKKFSIIGYSGGSSYAMACAYSLPERIKHISLVTARGPLDNFRDILSSDAVLLQLSKYTPSLLKQYIQIMITDIKQDPVKRLHKRYKHYHQTDKDCIDQHPEQQVMYAESLLESVRQGASGISQNIIANTQPWGFEPSDIQTEIHFWHGEKDLAFPFRAAKKLAQSLPNCETHFIETIGSMLIVHKWEDILTQIAESIHAKPIHPKENQVKSKT
ncbi:MAG: alpha/beta hydrolase [Ghiorsea sp.]